LLRQKNRPFLRRLKRALDERLMIRQQVGDFLEIYFEDKYYYIIVLTKIVMFGGNVVFAFHTNGTKQDATSLLNSNKQLGFNVCTDLLLAKKQGDVSRITKLDDVSRFWISKYAKAHHSLVQRGERAKRWYIYDVNDWKNSIKVKKWMTKKYKMAMDMTSCSFDVTANKILAKYTPDQNEFL